MPQEKERVRQVSGEPRGRVGEPKQDPDRGAEGSERPLLPQGRVAAGSNAEKRLQRNCFDRLCLSAH